MTLSKKAELNTLIWPLLSVPFIETTPTTCAQVFTIPHPPRLPEFQLYSFPTIMILCPLSGVDSQEGGLHRYHPANLP